MWLYIPTELLILYGFFKKASKCYKQAVHVPKCLSVHIPCVSDILCVSDITPSLPRPSVPFHPEGLSILMIVPC